MNLTQKVFLVNDINGNRVKVERCTINDVDTHFSLVKPFILKKDHIEYQDNMGVSVINRMAFKVGNDCFIYLNLIGNLRAEVYSFYGDNCPVKVLAMFSCILNLVHRRLIKISFIPHTGVNTDNFKSLVTYTSAKRQIRPNYPLVVRCDHLRNKLNSMYTKRGLSWEN